tara:strand:- start:504 stop:650 length:147 start_codon:yes stop_codon:yes gene_type:complete
LKINLLQIDVALPATTADMPIIRAMNDWNVIVAPASVMSMVVVPLEPA